MLLVEAAKDESGATPLFIASHYGNQKAVEFLVQHRAEVDLSLKTNASPLYVACQNGHKDTAAFLLMSGAEPDKQTDNLATSTFSAAQMGHFEIVKMLVEAKADKNMANVTDASPLFIAAKCPGLNACRSRFSRKLGLKTQTASENKQHSLPWSLCLMSFCKLFVAHSTTTPAGTRDRQRTSKNKSKQRVAKFRLAKGPPYRDLSFQIFLFCMPRNDHKEIVEYLLDKQACIDQRTESGASPTYIAAQKGCMQALQLLLDVLKF